MTKYEVFTGSSKQHHEQLLAERGGRIAYGFFRIRKRLGLVTADERSREDLIAYHESLRQDPKGMLWPEDDMTEQERDAWRLIGSGH
jgi:hypothetical protein